MSLHNLQSPPAGPPLLWGLIDFAIWLPQNTFILWVTLYVKKYSIYIISHLAWSCQRKTEKVRRQYSWPLNNSGFGPSKPLQPLSSQKFIYNFFIYNQLCPLLFIISHPYPWFHIQIQPNTDCTELSYLLKKSKYKWAHALKTHAVQWSTIISPPSLYIHIYKTMELGNPKLAE